MTMFGRMATQGSKRLTITGGTRQDYGDYVSFTFTSGGSLNVSGRLTQINADIFVVGGGGSGTNAT